MVSGNRKYYKMKVSDVLRDMEVGQRIMVKSREAKYPSLCNAAYRLKAEGYVFAVSQRGLIDETLVTRLK